jgi:hypothetical protein
MQHRSTPCHPLSGQLSTQQPGSVCLYVSICPIMGLYVSICPIMELYVSICPIMGLYVSMSYHYVTICPFIMWVYVLSWDCMWVYVPSLCEYLSHHRVAQCEYLSHHGSLPRSTATLHLFSPVPSVVSTNIQLINCTKPHYKMGPNQCLPAWHSALRVGLGVTSPMCHVQRVHL